MVETRHQRAISERATRDEGENFRKISLPPKNKTENNEKARKIQKNNLSFYLCLVIIAISWFTLPDSLNSSDRPTVEHVWYFGWISALSTALGVFPVVFFPNLHSYWIGVTNAITAGMMLAASYNLFFEGCTFSEPGDNSFISSTFRTIVGSFLGMGCVLSTKTFLDKHADLKVGNLAGADAQKVLLIIAVMTLHSISEGVGIGVSFGGVNGSELGVIISASIAVHNIPEGLAVAIVLLPRKVSKLTTALWCILTSIPQPIMAVPAFLFVHYFIPVLPVGLGFAGGAMIWVAIFELLIAGYEDTKNAVTTGIISTLSLVAMLVLQTYIDSGWRNDI